MSSVKSALEIAIALCVRGETLLVTRRRTGVHLAGFWEFPGGKREGAETFEQCATRELAEEVGVVARALRRRAPIEWEYPERRVTLYPVDCEWVEGEGETREVAEYRWVRAPELLTLEFPPANRELVRELAREL
jgi:mutator protein MutT